MLIIFVDPFGFSLQLVSSEMMDDGVVVVVVVIDDDELAISGLFSI